MKNPDTRTLVIQEMSEPQLFRERSREARVKIEGIDKMALNVLLVDHYQKVTQGPGFDSPVR